MLEEPPCIETTFGLGYQRRCTCRAKVLDNPDGFHLAADVDTPCDLQTLDEVAEEAALDAAGEPIAEMVREMR